MAIYMVTVLLPLLLLLGVDSYGGNALSIFSKNTKPVSVLNSSEPASLDLILRINILGIETTTTTTTTEGTPRDLVSIVRAEINGDWKRARTVLQLAAEARTVELKEAIYEALWLEMQQTRATYDPLKLLDFYEQLEEHELAPPELLEDIYKAFVSRSAQLIAAPFHTSSRDAVFPLVDRLLQRLSFSTVDYMRDILEALFDIVLALESAFSVAQRLGNLNGSLSQLSLANLQLLQRSELKFDAQAHEVVQDNLRLLLVQPNFVEDVKYSVRQDVYAQLSPDERVLYTAQKVCIRNVTEEDAYIYECPQTYLLCTNDGDPKKAGYHVERAVGGVNNTLQFAFQSSYWSNRYILLEANNQTTPGSILKSVYSSEKIFWWRLVRVPGGGMALYDAAASSLVLCGGNRIHWDGLEHHVYTRLAQDFEAYRNECTWSIEDCSDGILK